ncbi:MULTISPECIES: hypothetical protein [unclassified Halobacteriovorax]|uniref:hypothetical protein n=1 Tax=unclassified Halobacteriovorax TaxID=2639665 RepID=UPI00399BA32E
MKEIFYNLTEKQISIIISLFALLLSTLSYINSKKRTLITEEEYKEKLLGIKATLEQSFKWKKDEDLFASFLITISNLASITKSIINYRLSIKYTGPDDIVKELLIDQKNISIKLNNNAKVNYIESPTELTARTAVTGWLSFKIPPFLNNNKNRIEEYKIIITTLDDKEIYLESYILNERDI